MSRIAKCWIIPAFAVALFLTSSATRADAGGFSINIGTGGFGYGGHGISRYSSGFGGYGSPFGYSSFNRGHRAFGPAFYPNVSPRYGVGYRGYSPPRLNHRAPVFVPHRGFYQYRPSHFNLYRGHH